MKLERRTIKSLLERDEEGMTMDLVSLRTKSKIHKLSIIRIMQHFNKGKDSFNFKKLE